MTIKAHYINELKIAELISDHLIIKTTEDGLDILGNLYYQGFDKIIIHVNTITPEFFDLKNGMAGELLQKFSNYRVGLAIVGDFTPYSSKSLSAFMYESNRLGHMSFVNSVEDALKKFSGN